MSFVNFRVSLLMHGCYSMTMLDVFGSKFSATTKNYTIGWVISFVQFFVSGQGFLWGTDKYFSDTSGPFQILNIRSLFNSAKPLCFPYRLQISDTFGNFIGKLLA